MISAKNATFLTTGIIVGIAATGIAYYFGNAQKTVTQAVSPTPTQAATQPTATSSPQPSGATLSATLTGSLAYPSEVIPQDIAVCAQDTTTQEETCTSDHIQDPQYTYGAGYKLAVNPGTYYVYSQLVSFHKDYKAYYSEFVPCGLSVDCTSHAPIPVAVAAGQTVTGIDPIDWYDNAQIQQ